MIPESLPFSNFLSTPASTQPAFMYLHKGLMMPYYVDQKRNQVIYR